MESKLRHLGIFIIRAICIYNRARIKNRFSSNKQRFPAECCVSRRAFTHGNTILIAVNEFTRFVVSV